MSAVKQEEAGTFSNCSMLYNGDSMVIRCWSAPSVLWTADNNMMTATQVVKELHNGIVCFIIIIITLKRHDAVEQHCRRC